MLSQNGNRFLLLLVCFFLARFFFYCKMQIPLGVFLLSSIKGCPANSCDMGSEVGKSLDFNMFEIFLSTFQTNIETILEMEKKQFGIVQEKMLQILFMQKQISLSLVGLIFKQLCIEVAASSCCVKSCSQPSLMALFMRVCQCSRKTMELMIHACGGKEVEPAHKVHTLSSIVGLKFFCMLNRCNLLNIGRVRSKKKVIRTLEVKSYLDVYFGFIDMEIRVVSCQQTKILNSAYWHILQLVFVAGLKLTESLIHWSILSL